MRERVHRRLALGVASVAVLWLLKFGTPAHAQITTAPGARCGFVVECTRFDAIGLHLGTTLAARANSARSVVDAQAALRLSLTVGELAEGGVALAGHLENTGQGEARLISSPVSLFARLRLLPLPLGRLALAPLRVAVTYQHELVADLFGQDEPPGFSRGTLRLVAGWSLGRMDLDGGGGIMLARRDSSRLQPAAFELGAAASFWLWRSNDSAPASEFRLTAEGLARFSLDPAIRGEQNLLFGLLGTTASGYGGGVAVGVEVLDKQAGFLALARMQVSFGKRHQNPLAERLAAQPETTPAFIWKLLGAIDPVLGPDGCVWTDPTPERPSTQWFCIGQPAPEDASQIVLRGGKRLAVGTHLWELGSTLRLDNGSKVVEIPLHARFRKAVWDYLDRQERELAPNRERYRHQVCEGKVSILHGTENDPGNASMVALDPFGGQAALLGEELLRYIECNPDPSVHEQALMALSVLGTARRGGPLRARPPLPGRLGEGLETEAPAGKAGSGVQAGGVAEHAVPPKLGPPVLSAKVRGHVFAGELDKNGEAKGWHYEPTGDASKGTYVLEPTRSAPDAHGVYEANVVVQGVKKHARSSFFPPTWTAVEVEKSIAEAYQDRQPTPRPGRFRGRTAGGIEIEMEVNPADQIQTVYPKYQRGR